VSSSRRRTIGDALLIMGGVMILLLALVASDERVREQTLRLVTGGPPVAAEAVAGVGTRVGDLVDTVIHVLRAWTGDHVYLSLFAVAGVVLFMAVLKL
jgi:hypothetical protein